MPGKMMDGCRTDVMTIKVNKTNPKLFNTANIPGLFLDLFI